VRSARRSDHCAKRSEAEDGHTLCPSSHATAEVCLDLGVVLLATLALFLIAVWVLWRQARVLAHL